MTWKKLGKEGHAIKAPWPLAEEEDKILTRQSKFLQESLKKFRAQAGKAKKGCEKASVLVRDTYPQWKVAVLTFMQESYSPDAGFAKSFMGDLKKWASTNVQDKKLMKNTMQFASFIKNEVQEVGSMAMDIHLPFDQKTILEECRRHIEVQVNASAVDIINLDADEESASSVPENKKDIAEPGKPYLWLR